MTLQLRAHYASVRERLTELDAELRSDDVPLKRKLQILAEVDAVGRSVWPEQPSGLRRNIVETATLAAALPMAQPTNMASAASIVGTILSKPIDLFIAAVRRRRYRVLFKASRAFLRSKPSVNKLASLFGVPPKIINDGLSVRR